MNIDNCCKRFVNFVGLVGFFALPSWSSRDTSFRNGLCKIHFRESRSGNCFV